MIGSEGRSSQSKHLYPRGNHPGPGGALARWDVKPHHQIIINYLDSLAKEMGCSLPAQVVTSPAKIASAIGESVESVRRWLRELRRYGLVKPRERLRAGRTRYEVADPLDVPDDENPLGLVKPDPQLTIDWGDDEQDEHAPGQDEPLTVPLRENLPQDFHDRDRENPRENLSQDFHEAQAAGLREGGGETPSKARTIAPSSHGTIERGTSVPPLVHRTTGSMETMESDPATIGDVIGPALVNAVTKYEEATSPRQQKDRLERRILDVVADPRMHRSIAGKAADLVLLHGLPMKALSRVLQEVESVRRGAGFKESPGAFFQFKMKQTASQHDIAWPGSATKPR